MNRMNRKIEYALMALKSMSQKIPGQLTTAKEVAETTGSPFDATARVMQQMAQKGWLRSEQGAHGGYIIVRDLNKISLFDLYEAITGPVELVKCAHEQNECEIFNTCNIQSPLLVLNRRLSEFYRQLPLSELLRLKDATVKATAEAVV